MFSATCVVLRGVSRNLRRGVPRARVTSSGPGEALKSFKDMTGADIDFSSRFAMISVVLCSNTIMAEMAQLFNQ